MKKLSLGLKEALALTLEQIRPLGMEQADLAGSTDRIAASDLPALVNAPSIDSSMKDGYAVISREVAAATETNPVRLKLAGHMAAGGGEAPVLRPGTTVRILTGARIPDGADAVVSEEFTRPEGADIIFMNFAEPGRNILPRGSDVESSACVVRQGQQISPGIVGLLAAAGHSTVPVFRNPTVAFLGTGDEIVLPGEPLTDGKLYASNILTINAWCKKYGMKTSISVVHDDFESLTTTLRTIAQNADAVITSGGAWTGDRDLVVQAFEALGWQQFFHRIRIGPGKAVGFGLLEGKPIFILPGGPSSNLMGFLQIALPGLLAFAGHADPGLPRMTARLGADLKGREPDWTHFFFGRIEEEDGFPVFYPLRGRSRLRAIAEAGAIACIPENEGYLVKGALVSVQLLR